MKFIFKSLLLTMLFISLMTIPEAVFAFNDYSETKGTIGIFELGDTYDILFDKIGYLDSKKLLVEKEEKESICFISYKENLSDDEPLYIGAYYEEINNTKIVTSLIVYFNSEIGMLVKNVNKIKNLFVSDELLYQNKNYFGELTQENSESDICVWYEDSYYVRLWVWKLEQDQDYSLGLEYTIQKPSCIE